MSHRLIVRSAVGDIRLHAPGVFIAKTQQIANIGVAGRLRSRRSVASPIARRVVIQGPVRAHHQRRRLVLRIPTGVEDDAVRHARHASKPIDARLHRGAPGGGHIAGRARAHLPRPAHGNVVGVHQAAGPSRGYRGAAGRVYPTSHRRRAKQPLLPSRRRVLDGAFIPARSRSQFSHLGLKRKRGEGDCEPVKPKHVCLPYNRKPWIELEILSAERDANA